ncbi:restriction endonuclease subunit S [Roseateles sp. LKC17W]|uniref:Restriction endonuclease subunit S n=1 Tax=Pelomonas margarita TaxID=3299031 RepID=A0ABW7FF41_9BURK
MSSEWRDGKLGEFIELKRGYDLPQAKREAGPFPLISSSGRSDQHSSPMVRGPGVVTGRYGTIGQVFYVEEDFWPLNTTLYVRDFKGNDPRFISYFLQTVDFLAFSDKAAVPGINRNHLHEAKVQLAPVREQRKIAEFLGMLDQRITLLRETNATLEAIAQALFKSWFVDFDPVRAKRDGRAPEGMDEATAALFPDSFEDSELGEVPRGWLPCRLDSLLELAYGKALKAESRRPGPVPVYGSGGVTGWHDTALVAEPSIVVGRKGTVGSLYWESRPFFPIDTVFYVRTSLPMSYCFELLKTLGLQGMNTDAAVPGINRENVYRLLVPSVPDRVIAAFDAVVSSIRRRIDHNAGHAETLAALRDTLLPRLISGQLRLPEAAEEAQV